MKKAKIKCTKNQVGNKQSLKKQHECLTDYRIFFFLISLIHLCEFFLMYFQLPMNDPALGLCQGLVKAWQHYGNKKYV